MTSRAVMRQVQAPRRLLQARRLIHSVQVGDGDYPSALLRPCYLTLPGTGQAWLASMGHVAQ